jgi:hypothetical protein
MPSEVQTPKDNESRQKPAGAADDLMAARASRFIIDLIMA